MLHTLRLYKQKDLDLVTLHNSDRNFNRKMVKILCDYANGIRSFYPMNGVNFDRDTALKDNSINYENIYIHLSISKKNFAADDLLKKIRKGYKNDFIKSLVRSSLPYPISDLYFKEKYEFDMSEYEINGQISQVTDNSYSGISKNDESKKIYTKESAQATKHGDNYTNNYVNAVDTNYEVNVYKDEEHQTPKNASEEDDADFYNLINSLADF